MKVIKEYYVVLLIILVIIIIVLIKGAGRNNFSYDAVKRASPSVNKENLLTSGQLSRITGPLLTIDLDRSVNEIKDPLSRDLKIPADSILKKPYKSLIFKHKGAIILKSKEVSRSAGVWMVLTQMGKDNVFILTDQ